LLNSDKKKAFSGSKKHMQKQSQNTQGNSKKKQNMREPSRTIAVWLLVAVAVFIGLQLMETVGIRERTITYSQFQSLISSADVRVVRMEVVLKGINRATLHGELSDAASLTKVLGSKNQPPVKLFTVVMPYLDSPMLKEWDTRGIPYSFVPEKMNWGDLAWNTLPWLIFMVLFWVFMLRQMQAGQKGIFSFGKSRAKLNNMDRPQNTFADAAGLDEAKAELEEIIEFLKNPQKFKRLGGKIPKGVLLLGPPGTGKTLLARCVAGEAGVPFLSMSGSDFVEMFVGVGASRVRDLFDTAKRNSPSIIFVDEIDAVGRQRGAGLGGGHDEREQTLNQILVEMDGFEVNSGVILIAATNRPDVLDPALLRPGRFDRHIVVDVPDIKGREGIMKVHVKNIPLAPDVDLLTIAKGTPGFVGADLANLVNEAALMAARFGQEKVTMLDFEEAKDKVLMGVERKSMVLSDAEKRNTAYHEAGHAICNLYCKEADPLHKVTIIPRGRALGVTFSLPYEDKHSYTREFLVDRICILMGGRVAEELVFNAMTTGAANDIKQATNLVRKLICDYGMTTELGPLLYGEKDEQIFLGRDFNRHRDYSEKTAEVIDHLMRRIVEEQYSRAKDIIVQHRSELNRLAAALLEYELLDREDILKVIKGIALESPKKTRSVVKKQPAGGQGKQDTSSAAPEDAPKDAAKETVAASGDQNALNSAPPDTMNDAPPDVPVG
jgi:cell division protease FtsH